MTKVWLHSNRRVLLLAMVPVAVLEGLGALMLVLDMPTAIRAAAWLSVSISNLLFWGLIHQMLRPRIAYRDGFVCFYLKSGKPFEVPISIVEGFFLGQGPLYLPGANQGETKTVNLVARLSQREVDWAHREVKEALGHWGDGYVTIRGTWCEPLTTEVVGRLNRALSEASRATSSQAKE